MKLAALFLLMLMAACHKIADKPTYKPVEISAELSAPAIEEKSAVVKPAEVKPKVSKILREAVYFSASLEREALKLLLKDTSFQRSTVFSILSYILETFSGVKKSTPLGLDCGKFQLQFEKNQIFIEKACQRPFRELARINTLTEDREFEILFKVNEWGRVLGLTAVLTGSDVKCRISLVDQKLTRLNCENWFYQVSEDQMSSTVIKAEEFNFQRSAEQQFVIRGGFYKELIKNKKIDIVVPLEGKIKIIEKEIKVIDEFADQKNGVINEKKEQVEIKPVQNKKASEKALEQGDQETNQEGRQEIKPEEGQSEKNGEAQGGPEGQNPEGQVSPTTTEGEGAEPEPVQQPVAPPRGRGR